MDIAERLLERAECAELAGCWERVMRGDEPTLDGRIILMTSAEFEALKDAFAGMLRHDPSCLGVPPMFSGRRIVIEDTGETT